MKLNALLLIVALTSLSACGVPIASGAHFAESWRPESQNSFVWRDVQDRTYGDSRLEGNQFFHRVLHESVEWELSLRGIQYNETEPRLLIHHHLSLSDHVLESEVLDDSGQPTGETNSYVYEGASLVLHIVDARTDEDVWVAWAQANVEPAFDSPEAMRQWVYSMVGQMFDDWTMAPRG